MVEFHSESGIPVAMVGLLQAMQEPALPAIGVTRAGFWNAGRAITRATILTFFEDGRGAAGGGLSIGAEEDILLQPTTSASSST